jgi:phosphoenolpyruvate synthase/pyruvate phosphate dikinase
MADTYLSTSQYANSHGISKMQVIRLIRAGKIVAQRVGKAWMISQTANSNQIEYEKTESIQKWNSIINTKLHKNINIEKSKDREIIYSRLHSLGLPHERSIVFQLDKFPARHEFDVAIGRIGLPFWISAVPDPNKSYLNRLTKLGIYSNDSGWNFINKIPHKESFKIIISQYPEDTLFKGTLLISEKGNGIAEFITGDRHYIMTRGFSLTDPMVFNQDKILHYSKTITPSKQKHLYNLVRGIKGHLEVEYGKINKKNTLLFFDYNEEEAYTEVEAIWNDLQAFFSQRKRRNREFIYGLPASSGCATGKCVVVHHETIGVTNNVNKGDILVSDTTTPEMTPLMGKVAAIITDLGGVTSHAAIVCRELKIPAIVGTKIATEKLRTGMKVRVNADKGEIEILED